MRIWPILALVPLLPGCFDSHVLGTGDLTPDAAVPRIDAGAAPLVDAGACETIASTAEELACPSRVEIGAVFEVEVAHTTGLCCAGAGARATALARDERTWEVSTLWDRCDCCELCECEGPTVTQPVTIAAPSSAGTMRVIAGDHVCEIEVGSGLCERVAPMRAVVEQVVPVGAPIAIYLSRESAAGCGCRPRGWTAIGREGPSFAGLDVCDCSSEDPCVDPGYQATTFLAGAPTPGLIEIATDADPLRARVVDPGACRPPAALTITGIELGAPRRLLGSRDVWIAIQGTQQSCCPTRLLARHTIAGDGVIRLSLDDCNDPACAGCAGTPHGFNAWHHVGELAPGTYTVEADAARTTVVVE